MDVSTLSYYRGLRLQGPKLHLDVSGQQEPLLFLDLSVLQGDELHLNVPRQQKPVMLLDFSTLQGPAPHLDVSTLQ